MGRCISTSCHMFALRKKGTCLAWKNSLVVEILLRMCKASSSIPAHRTHIHTYTHVHTCTHTYTH